MNEEQLETIERQYADLIQNEKGRYAVTEAGRLAHRLGVGNLAARTQGLVGEVRKQAAFAAAWEAEAKDVAAWGSRVALIAEERRLALAAAGAEVERLGRVAAEAVREGENDRYVRAKYNRQLNEILALLPDRELGDPDVVAHVQKLVARAAKSEAVAVAERTLREARAEHARTGFNGIACVAAERVLLDLGVVVE